jgi:hypothetical protein
MRADLKETIVEREAELERTRRQVFDLGGVQAKRDEQQAEIAALEATIERMNHQHFGKLQELKAKYLKEKVEFQRSASVKVKRLEGRAQAEAVTCLTHHSHQVKADNRFLKKTLLSLINQNKAGDGYPPFLAAVFLFIYCSPCSLLLPQRPAKNLTSSVRERSVLIYRG